MISPRIFLIADDVKLLIKLEAELKRVGYRMLTAHDSKQGIYLAQAALPEVIVCDVTRWSLNDSDARSTLAQNSQTASIPFVSLTRPFDKQELVARVKEVFEVMPLPRSKVAGYVAGVLPWHCM